MTNMTALTNDEMVSVNGGEPITLTAVAIWVGYGLAAAAVGVAVGYAVKTLAE